MSPPSTEGDAPSQVALLLLIGLLRGAVLGTCAWIAGIIVFAIGLSIIFFEASSKSAADGHDGRGGHCGRGLAGRVLLTAVAQHACGAHAGACWA